MNGFKAAFRAELFVMLHNNAARFLLVMPAIAVIIRAIAVKLSDNARQAQQSLSGGRSFEDIASSNAWGHLVDSLSIGLTLLSLSLVAYAAWSFSSDRDNGALRHVVIRTTNRMGIVLAKFANVFLLALATLILLGIGSALITAILWDFGPIVEDGYELISSAEIRQEVALGLGLAILPIPTALAFGVLVSVSTQSATQAITTALGITLAVDIFKSVLGSYAYYIYASFQPSLVDRSYLSDVGRLVRGYSDVMVDTQMLSLNQWIPLPQMLVFIAAALVVVRFRKL
ncbi:MAG: ABC transporter permease subunit [Pseudohongiellaceae bacterium]|nr:ABC transporter permease subunit [Pseudohongiellaceae bacterium]